MENNNNNNLESEKCLLVTELTQVVELVKQLGVYLDCCSLEFCKGLASKIHLSVAKSIIIAKTCYSKEKVRAPDLPRSDEGIRGSDCSSQAGVKCNYTFAQKLCKKRKTQAKCRNQVRVSSVGDLSPLDDGYSWRKYGQKDILGAKYPRAYFRCTHRNTHGCLATKQVQRTDDDPLVFDVIYNGTHTCIQINQSKFKTPDVSQMSIVKTEGLMPEPQDLSSMTFSLSSTPVSMNNNTINGCFMGSFISPFVSPVTSESNYLSVSPYQNSSHASGFGFHDVEPELGEAISVPTSTTNSPMADMDFFFDQLELDAHFNSDSSGSLDRQKQIYKQQLST